MINLQDAYLKGFDAYMNGFDYEDNPFENEYAEKWSEGMKHAETFYDDDYTEET